MRVLLIEAPVVTITPHSHLSPPLGLAYVAQHLLEAGHQVELVDLNLSGFNPARLHARLNRFDPNVVGISSHTETYPNALTVARAIQEERPSIQVMSDGPHVSIRTIEALAEADSTTRRREGEHSAVELSPPSKRERGPDVIARSRGLDTSARSCDPNQSAPSLDSASSVFPERHNLLSLDL